MSKRKARTKKLHEAESRFVAMGYPAYGNHITIIARSDSLADIRRKAKGAMRQGLTALCDIYDAAKRETVEQIGHA